jgi:hypothetical protein
VEPVLAVTLNVTGICAWPVPEVIVIVPVYVPAVNPLALAVTVALLGMLPVVGLTLSQLPPPVVVTLDDHVETLPVLIERDPVWEVLAAAVSVSEVGLTVGGAVQFVPRHSVTLIVCAAPVKSCTWTLAV